MIHVIDYGAGNLGSIINILNKVSSKGILASTPESLEEATKIILPGVGSFDHGMQQLMDSGMIDVLNKKVLEEKVPILGICLGAQLMCRKSEEGELPGLGWLQADVIKFTNPNLKVPHMGWNRIETVKNTPLEVLDESRFYFVHSYYMKPDHTEELLFKTKYGKDFASGLNSNNIFACQFHPEKSHKYGFKLIKSFLAT